MSVDTLLSCRDYVQRALVTVARDRGDGLEWIESERVTVAVAANQWAEAHGVDRRITVADVERVEVTAVGHFDYAAKLALYVAELIVWGGSRVG